MAKYTATLTTAAADTFVCNVNKKRDFICWQATMFAYGTFGGGTVNWLISPDRGVTKIPMYDISGTAYTSTANDDFTVTLGGGGTNSDCMQIYATLTGSAGASVTLDVFDNNNQEKIMRHNTLQVQTLQLLLELAKGLSELQKDPKALQKAIDESYGYDAEMQKKANDAKIMIDNAAIIQAEINKQKESIQDITVLIAKSEALEAKIKNDKAELKKEESALSKRESALKQAEDEILKSQNAITAREAKIAQKESSLIVREENIAAQEKELKEKADKIKSLVA